jgi:hypothetical protein
MREDMGKVLVERPRVKSCRYRPGPAKGYRKSVDRCYADDGSPPRREGIKTRYGSNRKYFNEHLGPLRRFLNSNVGRPWDKVYSEICKHVDRGNVVQKHILTHLFDYVVVNTVLIDGEPCCGERHRGYDYGEPLRTTHRWHQWYVCPKSGLLRRSKYVPRDWRKKPDPPRMVRLNNKQVCVDRGGQWELISIAIVAKHLSHDVPAYEEVLQRGIDARGAATSDEIIDHGEIRYRLSRRALSRKELLAMPIPIEWLK